MALRRIFKVFFILAIVVGLVFASVAAYLLFNGRQILLARIEKELGVEVGISTLKLALPASLVAEDVRISSNIQVGKVIITPSLLGLVKGDVVLNSLILQRPRIEVTRRPDGSFDLGPVVYISGQGVRVPRRVEKISRPSSQESLPAQKEAEGLVRRGKRFFLNSFKVRDGSIDFIDESISTQEPFRTAVSHLNIDVARSSLLQDTRRRFRSKGEILSEENQQIGRFEFSGWVDPAARDMDAQILSTDIRLSSLRPYYKKFLKRELKSADMVLSGDLKSENNNLRANCHVELSEVAFVEEAQEPSSNADEPSIDVGELTFLAFDSLLSSEGKLVFDFMVDTKMDNPKFENIKFKGTIFQSAVKAALSKPPEEVKEDFREIGEKFEEIGREFKKMFKKD